MRYGILSDIHANAEALEAVINVLLEKGIKDFLCCGDTVGYGADPKRCLNALKRLKAVHIAGNHDWAVSGRIDATYFTEDGKAAILWTRNNISLEEINYLNNFELTYKNKHLILVHATLDDPLRYDYLNKISKCAATFNVMDKPVCFIGHTHIPQIFIQQGHNIYNTQQTEIEINPENKYIINVGSVGQPRDNNPMASYAIYDTDQQLVEIKRVRYNVLSAQKAILEAGLPAKLAQRLTTGE